MWESRTAYERYEARPACEARQRQRQRQRLRQRPHPTSTAGGLPCVRAKQRLEPCGNESPSGTR